MVELRQRGTLELELGQDVRRPRRAQHATLLERVEHQRKGLDQHLGLYDAKVSKVHDDRWLALVEERLHDGERLVERRRRCIYQHRRRCVGWQLPEGRSGHQRLGPVGRASKYRRRQRAEMWHILVLEGSLLR